MGVVGLTVGGAVGLHLGVAYVLRVIAGVSGFAIVLPIPLDAAFGWLARPTPGPVHLSLLLILLIHVPLTVLAYAGAQAAVAPGVGPIVPDVGPITPDVGPIAPTAPELFCRGFMIGMNAGVNFVVLLLLPGFGGVVAWPVLVINGLAAIPRVSTSAAFQGFLGWFCWLMPMSWPATALGLAVFVVNRVALLLGLPTKAISLGPVTGVMSPTLAPYRFDWRTGTIITHGGYCTVMPGGYDLGNFAHIHLSHTDFPESPGATIESLAWHETGHTLNLGAFGWIFHLPIGAVHQNVIGAGALAYSELTAESHRRATTRAWVALWGVPPNTPPTATPDADPTTAAAGTPVALVGTMTDPETVAGTFFWALVAAPPTSGLLAPGAPPAFADPHLVAVSFTPDVPGVYGIELTVDDTVENGPPAPLLIVAT